MLIKILKFVGLLVIVMVIVVVGYFWRDATSDKYDIKIAKEKNPLFNPIDLDFEHQYNGDESLPISPSALIDINNDNVNEVF